MLVQTTQEYDKCVEQIEAQAKKQFPGYVRYEFCGDTGELFLWSLGAYPSIIKNYTDKINFEY